MMCWAPVTQQAQAGGKNLTEATDVQDVVVLVELPQGGQVRAAVPQGAVWRVFQHEHVVFAR